MDPAAEPRIAIVIPTFNEFELLDLCIQSIEKSDTACWVPIVVNAGQPLPESIASRVQEHPVADSFFWTSCIDFGLRQAKEQGFDYVMLTNADTEFAAGSLEAVLEVVQKAPNVVACMPGYVRKPDGSVELIYSDDKLVPFFLHNYLQRRWKTPEEAPEKPYETDLLGGQGVIFAVKLLDRFGVDPKHFPHNRGDHDLWLSMKRGGCRLLMVPQAAVINNREFGTKVMSLGQKLKRLPYLFFSPRARDSWQTLFWLRWKHLPKPLGVLSWLIYTPLIWLYRLIRLSRA